MVIQSQNIYTKDKMARENYRLTREDWEELKPEARASYIKHKEGLESSEKFYKFEEKRGKRKEKEITLDFLKSPFFKWAWKGIWMFLLIYIIIGPGVIGMIEILLNISWYWWIAVIFILIILIRRRMY